MNVIYILNCYPKISEFFILSEMQRLIDSGVNVDVFALSKNREFIKHEAINDYQSLSNPKYVRGLSRTACRRPSTFLRSVHAIGKLFQLGYWRRRYWKSAWKAACIWASARPFDQIHTHFIDEAALVAFLLSRISGCPFSVTTHAYDLYDESIAFWAKREILSNANLVVTPSYKNRRYLSSRWDVDSSRVLVARATSFNRYSGQVDPRYDAPDRFVILGVGRYVRKKGFDVLIDAVTTLRKTIPNILVRLIGEGELESAYKLQIAKLGLQKHVHIFALRTNEECLNFLRSADVAVLPSRETATGDQDICPLTLQEAMRLGVPVVSTQTGSINELVISGYNGLLVPPERPDLLTQAIIQIHQNSELRTRFTRNASAYIAEHFDPSTETAKVLESWKRGL